jgi:DNA-binding Xre family transcriptional regulator
MSKTYVIDALRLHLKARNITYKELAQAIDLSEISVKRLFTGGDCSLDRLEQICQYELAPV